MSGVYDNWERLVRATLRREQLIVSGLRTPSDYSLASSSSFSLRFNSSSARVSSFNFSGLLVGDSFSYDQILKATDYLSSSNLIKYSCSGDIFYGVLEDGTQVSVKKIDLSSLNKQSYLRSELEFFGKVSHSRFVPFLGHCLENWNEKFLVYKYIPYKDLSSSLYRREIVPDDNVDCPSTFLDWKTRLKIAIGAAQGLCYLHHQCVPPLVHRNVEASSILIDENFEVRLGKLNEVCSEKKHRNQSWILRLLRLPKSSDRSSDDTSNATCAYDVYCFGKVMLELVTGKTGFSADSDSTVRDWMANALPYITTYNKELFVNIVDPSLFVDEHLLIEVWAVAVVATACLSPKPSKRPHMTHILEALEDPKSVRFSSNGFLEPTISAVASAPTVTKIPERSELVASGTEEDFTNGEIRDVSKLRMYRFSELMAATRNFRQDTVLGEGEFGRVYKGWLNKRSSSENGNEPPIAIKRLNTKSLHQSFEEWQNEIDILGRLSHPNLIKLLGFSLEENELLLVYEFMQKGSLKNHLFGRGSAVQALPWDIRLKILTGAARGLAFLHASEKPVIYRDFKPSHILLDGSYNAKISDFGLAKRLPSNDESHVTTRVMGTFGYAAPEYIATGHLHTKSDVYDFGVVLAEVLTGLRAHDTNRRNGQHYLADWIKPHLSDRRKLTSIMDYRLEGKYPLKTAEKMAQLAVMCLSTEPNARPSMKEVVDILEGIESAVEKPKEPSTN